MKKILAILMAAICTFSLAGCDEGKDNGKTAKDKEIECKIGKEDVAYIRTYELFNDLERSKLYDGNGYMETLNNDEIDDKTKLSRLNTIYFEENSFTQFFCNDLANDSILKANFNFENNEIIPEYNSSYSYITESQEDFEYKWYSTEELKSEAAYEEFAKKIDAANSEEKFFSVIPCMGIGIVNDKFLNTLNSPQLTDSRLGGNFDLHIRDNQLVIKQKGYSFENVKNKNSFTIIYDNSDFSEDIHTLKQSKISFNKDGVWKGSLKIDGVDKMEETGKWELKYGNLLVMYCSEEYKEKNNAKDGVYAMFYVDFEQEEIAIPAFIECEYILKLAKKVSSKLK